MPTPLEIILDPISVMYIGLMIWEGAFPARELPESPDWKIRGLIAFTIYFFLSSYLPLLTDPFGTFYNPRHFENETGFYNGASSKIGKMLFFKDVSQPEFDHYPKKQIHEHEEVL